MIQYDNKTQNSEFIELIVIKIKSDTNRKKYQKNT